MITHYELLGLERDATLTDIKKAGRGLLMVVHPDRNSGNKFAPNLASRVNEAYEVLSDPARKEMYDLSLPALQAAKKTATSDDVAKARAAEEKAYNTAERFSARPRPRGDKYTRTDIFNLSASRIWSYYRSAHGKQMNMPHGLPAGVGAIATVLALGNMPSEMNLGLTIFSAALTGAGTAGAILATRYIAAVPKTIGAVFGNAASRLYVVNAQTKASAIEQTRIVSGATKAGAALLTLSVYLGILNEGYDLTKHTLVSSVLGYEHKNRSMLHQLLAKAIHYVVK